MFDTLMHWLGYGLCHQLPARSFFGGGVQVPVCARDTGIYLGFVVSLGVLLLLARRRRPSAMPGPVVLLIVAASIGLLVWDGVTSYAGWRTTTNDIRLATGLFMGYSLPVILLPLLNGQLWKRSEPARMPDGALPTLTWLAPLPVSFAVIRWLLPFLGIGYALLVTAAVVVTFVTTNLAIVSILPFAEGRAERAADILPALGISLFLTFAEVAASAWLRAFLTGLAGRVG